MQAEQPIGWGGKIYRAAFSVVVDGKFNLTPQEKVVWLRSGVYKANGGGKFV